MLRLVAISMRMFVSAFRSRRHLLLENLALRAARHLGASATPSHPARRPSLLGRPSAVVVWLGGRLVIVKPETVIRWHRAGLRLYWRWLSRRGKQGGRPACRQRSARPHSQDGDRESLARPQDPRRVTSAGVHRFRAQRVSLPSHSPTSTRAPPELDDIFEEPSRSDRRDGLLHRADGDLPNLLCTLRDTAPPTRDFTLEPHGASYGVLGHAAVAGRPSPSTPQQSTWSSTATPSSRPSSSRWFGPWDSQPTRISYRSPWQNGVAERFVGTLRRELLDHTIVSNDRHLRRLLFAFVEYYHEDRTHLRFCKDTALGRPTEPRLKDRPL